MRSELDTIRDISSVTLTSVNGRQYGGGDAALSEIQTSDTYAEVMSQARSIQAGGVSGFLRTDDFSATSPLQGGGAEVSDFKLSTVPTQDFSPTSSYNPVSMTEIEYGQKQAGGRLRDSELDFSDFSFSSLLSGGDDEEHEEEKDKKKKKKDDSEEEDEEEEDEEDDEDEDDDEDDEEEESSQKEESLKSSGKAMITGARKLNGGRRPMTGMEDPSYLLSESPISSFGTDWDASATEYSTLMRA